LKSVAPGNAGFRQLPPVSANSPGEIFINILSAIPAMVKVRIGKAMKDLPPKPNYEGVCFAITTGKGGTGPTKLVTLVKVPGGSKYGKDVYRFAEVLESGYCAKVYKLPRNVPKNKVGKREFAKVIGFIHGKRATLPGYLAGKIAAKRVKTVKGIAKQLRPLGV